jgi:hypothetical protein
VFVLTLRVPPLRSILCCVCYAIFDSRSCPPVPSCGLAKTKECEYKRHKARRTRCNCQSQPSWTNRNEVYTTKRSILIQDLAGQVQQHRNMAGPNGIYVGFHVLGGG